MINHLLPMGLCLRLKETTLLWFVEGSEAAERVSWFNEMCLVGVCEDGILRL